jgi:hypothetical protein
MWNMKCFVIPVIIGATGIVSKSLQKYLETIPGQHTIDSLQKTAILGTWHIIRKVLQAEAWSLSGGVHRWLKGRSTREERKPVTRHDDDDDDDDLSGCATEVCTVSDHRARRMRVWIPLEAWSFVCVSLPCASLCRPMWACWPCKRPSLVQRQLQCLRWPWFQNHS